MDARSGLTTSVQAGTSALYSTRLYRDGIVSGMIGGATIAIWFLILDTLANQPLFTPSLLGTALFKSSHHLIPAEGLPISLNMVLAFSCVHGLIFMAIGTIWSWLLSFAEREPYLGLGGVILFLLVVFEFGFLATAMLFADVIIDSLSWVSIFIGNGLAAGVMGAYLWHRHPSLSTRVVNETFFS